MIALCLWCPLGSWCTIHAPFCTGRLADPWWFSDTPGTPMNLSARSSMPEVIGFVRSMTETPWCQLFFDSSSLKSKHLRMQFVSLRLFAYFPLFEGYWFEHYPTSVEFPRNFQWFYHCDCSDFFTTVQFYVKWCDTIVKGLLWKSIALVSLYLRFRLQGEGSY